MYKLFMSNNHDIPDTWGISDDQANKISEALNRRSTYPEVLLQEAIEELARDITIIEPDPKDWEWWINHLIDTLSDEAKKKHVFNKFLSMLLELKQSIGN